MCELSPLRQVSHRYHVIDIEGGKVRMIISVDGVLHIKLKINEFGNKVRKKLSFFKLA